MNVEELKRIRRKHGLTQEQLARELEIERTGIAKWETGERTIPLSRAKMIRMVLAMRDVA